MNGVAILRGAGCGRGGGVAGHVLFPLPGFDFGTSLICSIIVLTYYHSCWLLMSITVCTGAHSFCNTCACILFPVPVNCSCSSNWDNSDKWYFPDRQQLVFVFNGVEINRTLISCTCCYIIINFINDTETEFIWRTLLNMSQGTASLKKNLQNDLCVLRRLRSDYAVRVAWSASSLKKPLVLCSHTATDRESGKTG